MHTFNEPTPTNPELGYGAFVIDRFDELISEAGKQSREHIRKQNREHNHDSRTYAMQPIGEAGIESAMVTPAVRSPKQAYELFMVNRTGSQHGASSYNFLPVNPTSFGDSMFPLVHAQRGVDGRVLQLEGRVARIRDRSEPLQVHGAFAPSEIAESIGGLRVVTPLELAKHREWNGLSVRMETSAGSLLSLMHTINEARTSEAFSGRTKAIRALGEMARSYA